MTIDRKVGQIWWNVKLQGDLIRNKTGSALAYIIIKTSNHATYLVKLTDWLA
jgi:hypothetical protein